MMSILLLQSRPAMVIAIGRTGLVLFILLTARIDPPAVMPPASDLTVLLLAYLALSAAIAWLGLKQWWLEHRLAPLLFALDILALSWLVIVTGGAASPFLVLSAFLFLSAATIWPARLAMGASLFAALVLLGSACLGSTTAHSPIGWQGSVTRAGTLFVLGAMILWFWFARSASISGPHRGRALDGIVSADPPCGECLVYAAEYLSASRALLFWSEPNRPWLDMLGWDGRAFYEERIAAEGVDDPSDHLRSNTPFLFDSVQRRLLLEGSGEPQFLRKVDPFPHAFAARFGLERGLAIPIQTSRFDAVLIADGISGFGGHCLETALVIQERATAAFERSDRLASIQQARTSETRLALARNLHDGAAQFLAGLALKIRSIKDRSADAEEARRGLADIESDLARQQQELRAIIAKLRTPNTSSMKLDFRRSLKSLAARLQARWRIAVETESSTDGGAELLVDASYRYQLEQMISEAASNAVRHGRASHLRLRLSIDPDALQLDIADDGSGFAFIGARSDEELWQHRLGPLSLHQRVRSLGGSLAIQSSPKGATLSLRLPLEQQP
jgi:signal transduction histidine kinase